MKTVHALLMGIALLGAPGCAEMTFERGGTRGEAGPVGSPHGEVDPAPADTPIPSAAPPAPAPEAPPRAAAGTPKPDSSAMVRIASWWKFGGTPASLDADMQACQADLGPGHAPQSGGTLVTVGMRDCLRERGWRGAGEAPAP